MAGDEDDDSPMVRMLDALPQDMRQALEQSLRQAMQEGIPAPMQALMGEDQSQNTLQRLTGLREQLEKQEQNQQTEITVRHYHCDHLGTPLALTDQNQQIVWAARLDPWGNIEQEFNPHDIDQAIRLPGQHHDKETGLYYNRHRYYDPHIGSYVNQDPIGLAGGINVFAYVGGNPLGFADPEGLQAYMCAAGLSAWCKPPQRPPGPRLGAMEDFWRNYNDMRNANTINADKYFHCKANCEAARRGPAGERMSCLISDGREWFDQFVKGDPPQASIDDQAANAYGRAWGTNTGLSCDIACGQYRPSGLPSRY